MKYIKNNINTKFKKGQTPWNKGKKHSAETKKKISIATRGVKKPLLSLIMKGKVPWNKGLCGVQSGENSPRWKGGITPVVCQIRHCFLYRQWRSDIFTRDNFTCVWCGARNGNGKTVVLNADHHPKSFSQIFHDNNIKTLDKALECQEFWNINNGRTLCLPCHNKTKGGNQSHGS